MTRRRLRERAAAAVDGPAEVLGAAEEIVERAAQVVEGVPAADAAEAPAETPAENTDADDATEDEFLRAARALNFTGETPTRTPSIPVAPAKVAESAAPQPTEHVAPHRRGSAFRRLVTATASVGAMGAIGLLAVGMTTPLGAVAHDDARNAAGTVSVAAQSDTQKVDDEEIQAFVASSEVHNADVERAQGYEAQTFAQIASASGINTSGAFFSNDPHADIQWPFAVGTGMSSGFGPRWGRMHEGIDFTPGEGAPIQVVADGVVRTATEAGGAYGVNVYVDHVIDGKVITTHYAHMLYGSIKVKEGQRVKVGDVLGLTGNTGRSYGAHLHFEVIVNGSAIDPLPWLKEHANTRYSKEEKAKADEALTELLGSEITSE